MLTSTLWWYASGSGREEEGMERIDDGFPGFAGRMEEIEQSATVALCDKADELRRSGRDVVSLAAGEPDFPTPAPIIEAASRAMHEGWTKYAPSAGLWELREAVAGYVRKSAAVEWAGAEEVMILPGAKAGVMFAMLALLDSGDECICLEPCWVSYKQCIRFAGARYVPLALDPHVPLTREALDAISGPRTKMLVVNSPCNPTGRVLTAAEVEAVASFALERGVMVLSDEIYERIVYDGTTVCSPAALDGMEERCILLNGFSKAYSMTGWRLGYCVASRSLIRQMIKIQQHTTTSAATFVQRAGLEALSNCDSFVEDMRREFERRRDFLLERLSFLGADRLVRPAGAFYLWMRAGRDETEFCGRMLERHGIVVTPGRAFGGAGAGWVRVSFAASMDALERFVSAVEEELR